MQKTRTLHCVITFSSNCIQYIFVSNVTRDISKHISCTIKVLNHSNQKRKEKTHILLEVFFFLATVIKITSE